DQPDLPALRRRQAGEDRQDAGSEDVAADAGQVGRCLLRPWLFYHAVDPGDSRFHRLALHHAILPGVVRIRGLEDGDHAAAMLLIDIQELACARGIGRDKIVAPEHGERLVADELTGAKDRVPVAELLLLPDIVE